MINKSIEERIEAIEQRNQRVEFDKAWETSWTRRLIILILTYGLIGFYMDITGLENPWLNSIVPAIGFLISTFVVGFAKNFWVERHK